MPNFGEFVEKAKDLAEKHPDQVHKGIEKSEELAEKHLGESFNGQIEHGGEMVEGFLDVHEPDAK